MVYVYAAAAVIGAIGAITEGNNADKVATRNAEIMNQQANDTRNATGEREALLRQRNNETLSSQRAAMLQNGIDPATGSALVGSEQQLRDAEMDALTLRYQGMTEARGMNMQADLTRFEGKTRKSQSRLSAAGKLLSAYTGYTSAGGYKG